MPVAGIPIQGIRIIAQNRALAFYQEELSRGCSFGQLPKATGIILILLVVSLALVVGTLAPKGDMIFVLAYVKEIISLLYSVCYLLNQ